MNYFPWLPVLMLTFESNSVIATRLMKLTKSSRTQAAAEIKLMVSEKLAAAVETSAILMSGGSPSAVVTHYREAVAANATRLALPT